MASVECADLRRCLALSVGGGKTKPARTSEPFRATEARLVFPPPYAPSLNPVERTFAKIKLRRR